MANIKVLENEITVSALRLIIKAKNSRYFIVIPFVIYLQKL